MKGHPRLNPATGRAGFELQSLSSCFSTLESMPVLVESTSLSVQELRVN